MATWPSTLPVALIDGYGLESGDATVRTDMDSGPARVRLRYRATPDAIPMKFLLTDEQMVIFRAWWDGDAAQGSAWFDMPLKDGRTAAIATKEVRPNPGKFKADFIGGGFWSLSFTVEVRNA